MNDWDTVTVLKKKPLKAAQMKTESAINQARKPKFPKTRFFFKFLRFISLGRQGLEVETHQKCKRLFKNKHLRRGHLISPIWPLKAESGFVIIHSDVVAMSKTLRKFVSLAI